MIYPAHRANVDRFGNIVIEVAQTTSANAIS